MRYLPYYTPREHRRHDVRPGITGWAQVNGRNYLPWDERLALDVWYVDNWSLWLDLKILIKTFLQVLRREGVSADPDAAETDLDRERSAWCKDEHPDPGTKECR
jgi:lipopolysaccharide/colanic/teichoic acid biosynthesis glycosyltransferase